MNCLTRSRSILRLVWRGLPWAAWVASFWATAAVTPKGAVFRAGVAKVDISPTQFPVLVNAMFTERTATNVVDRLEVCALALDDGHSRLAMAVVDTCMISRDLIDRAKEAASRTTGIPTDHLLVSATHTHSAPSAMGCLGSRMDTNYARFLEPRIAEALVAAVAQLQPARIGWGRLDDWDHTHNRRWIRRPDRMLTDPFGDRNVRAHMHPGHESPDAVGPSGPVDPGLTVVAVESTDGAPLALLANYSQHYYGSPLVSSDYYGRFRRYLAEQLTPTGRPLVALMSQGTSGDLMWMDYSAPARDVGYEAYAQAMAGEAASVWRQIRFQSWVPLRMAETTLALNYRTPNAARLDWARQVAAGLTHRLPATLPEVYALESLYLNDRPRTELKLQAIGIGDLGIAALPNEVFALTGLKLKGQSPFPISFNIELANGAEGYIPPPEQHFLGGYTTWPARTAGLEVSAEPQIVERLLRLQEEISGRSRKALEEPWAAYPKAVVASRPLAYWRLNEAVPPVARDASGNSRAARYEDGVALYLPGASHTVGFHPSRPEAPNAFSGPVINRAPHFAGGRLRAMVPNLGKAYSLELWFWNGLPATARDWTGHLGSRGSEWIAIGGTNRVEETGRLVLGQSNATDHRAVGRTQLEWRRWHHLVLVREGSRASVYLDGQTRPEIQTEIASPSSSGDEVLYFAGRPDGIANFEGKLDEIAVYQRGLRPEEIASHYRAAGF